MRPETTERPWGNFRRFTLNEPTTVKIIKVLPNQELSLQFHKGRSEFWRILRGNPIVTIDEQVIEAKAGDEFEIGVGAKHRIRSQDQEVEFMEISKGNFDENDIVRLEDRYGRV